MKPLKLIFKGINSFSEQTEIDFDKLTKNGIFGIFGDTGSGKSTILDCINFALYGRVERSKEKLDIINYRSDGAEVTFEFVVLCEGVRRQYTVERSLKKKSGLHKAMLYEDGDCIADNATTVTKKITEVLGVDAEDFRKCIALPQGEFSQFVKSQPSERIALIERLFSLSKYGDRLKDRLKQRESEAELAFQTVSVKLGTYSDVSENILSDASVQIGQIREEVNKLSAESAAAEKRYMQLKALGERKAELEETKNKLSELLALKPQMEQLKAGLKAAPFCKTAVETSAQLTKKREEITVLANRLNELNVSVAEIQKLIAETKSKTEEGNFDGRLEKCIALAAKYSSAEGKGEKLSTLEKQLAARREEYRSKDERIAQLKQIRERAEKAVKEAEARLSAAGAADLKNLIYTYFKGAFLRDEYVNSLDYFVGLNGQLKFFKEDSDLYNFIERDIKQQIAEYKERVSHVKDFTSERAEQKLKEFEDAARGREKLTDELNDRKSALKDAETAVAECLREMQIIKKEGAELRTQYDEIKSELDKIYGADCKDRSAAEKSNLDEAEKIKAEKKELSCRLDRLNVQLNELSARRAETQAKISSAASDAAALEEKLRLAIQNSGQGSLENCEKLAAEFSGFADAETAIEEYGAKLRSLTARSEELSSIPDISCFTAEKLTSAQECKNSAASALSQSREKLAVCEADYKKAEKRLEEKKVLQTEYSEAEKQRNLIARLKELTKGNKFMEYIANEYLYDISSLASSTLLKLTDGRYFLTYTDTFYAGDNFDCGNLRGVNTLSGGETFLVSLSLALALSQTICSSLKSIEFFFLDEGFGTLDGTLVDTVMNALEKLKSSRFTIGVISHVEELKHRIDSKITVYKATETHGSYVQISC